MTKNPQKLPRKHALVLGGTGFIGAELVQQLLAKNYRVSLLVHHRAEFQKLEDVNIVIGNLNSIDFSLFKEDAIDLIFHLARIPGRNAIGRYLAARRGAKANRRLVRELKAHKIEAPITYVSGSLMYGNSSEKVNEMANLNPIAYAKQYWIAEKALYDSMLKKEFPIRFVRPAWIVGKASWFKYFYLKFIEEHQCIPIFGEKSRYMNLIHVKDCAGMIIHYAAEAPLYQPFNIFGPEAISAEAFALILSEKLKLPIRHYTAKESKKMFDSASFQALTSSIALDTLVPEIKASYKCNFSQPEQIIEAALN